jgi:hypothetical protein
MTQKEFLQGAWINVSKILPPDKDEDILIFVPPNNFFVRPAYLCRMDAERFLPEINDGLPFKPETK